MTAYDLTLALLRTTLATAAAACVATLLLALLRVSSPRTHRVAWALVVLQGWALLPWTITVEQEAPATATLLTASTSAWTSTEAPTDAIHRQEQGVAPLPSTAAWRPEAIAPAATIAWFAGAAVLALLAVWRYARIARSLPLGVAPNNPAWQTEWQREFTRAQREAARATPVFRPTRIDFRLTDRLGPLVAYIPFAYRVLAPHALWAALTRPERRAILRHELAHIHRRDLWKSLALRVLALPQWFNPLVWHAVRRFDEAAEWSCDATAARGLTRQPTTIAAALIRTAELTAATASVRGSGVISAIPAEQPSALARRIHRLVNPRFKEESTMRKLLVPALLAALAAAQLIRIERVAADPPSDPSQGAGGGPLHSAYFDSNPQGPLAAAPAPPTPAEPPSPPTSAPRELAMRTLPRYVIEPPDIIVIDAVRLVPKRPYRVAPHDVLRVRVEGASPDQPIDDAYSVDADGTLNFGPTYGRVAVDALTIDEIQQAIHDHLGETLNEIEVSVSLQQSTDVASVSGQHLVAMDGRVNLGAYGSVFVAGLTVEEARRAIEKQLTEQLDRPQVALDVLAYNSKVYYIITADGVAGDDVVRAPITGNETVLDAVANVGGISQAASTKMWIARPALQGAGSEQILPVAWDEIARGASTETNYQLLPGDRLFIETAAPLAVQEHAVASPYASPARKAVQFTVKTEEGATLQFDGETDDQTLSEFLRDLPAIPTMDGKAPDLSSALITLSRDVGPEGSGGFATYAIGWDSDEGKPSDGDDRELLDGDRITLDFRKPEPGAVVLPHPILPSPTPAPPTEAGAAAKQQIEYSIAFIEDIDGDFAEIAREEGDAGVAFLDAATLEPALRVLQRHNHIKRLADPRLIAKLGDPAHFNAAVPIPGGDRLFRTQYKVRVRAQLASSGAESSRLKMALAAMARHNDEVYSADTGFMLRPGRTAIVRLRSEIDDAAGPIYVVVTPSAPE